MEDPLKPEDNGENVASDGISVSYDFLNITPGNNESDKRRQNRNRESIT